MTFLFYETCVPMALAAYAFFWPIIVAGLLAMVFAPIWWVIAVSVCIAAGCVGCLYARALSLQRSKPAVFYRNVS